MSLRKFETKSFPRPYASPCTWRRAFSMIHRCTKRRLEFDLLPLCNSAEERLSGQYCRNDWSRKREESFHSHGVRVAENLSLCTCNMYNSAMSDFHLNWFRQVADMGKGISERIPPTEKSLSKVELAIYWHSQKTAADRPDSQKEAWRYFAVWVP